MIIPIDWLKDYVDIDKPASEIAKSFTSIGLMLDKPTDGQVLDLEHRMDRSDWLSIIGCARDLAAIESLKLKHPKYYTKKGKQLPKDEVVKIRVQGRGMVNRFNTRVFKNIKVSKSPKWLADRLEAYGIPSINNIVDITNYVMIELGQPLHAQDLAKFQSRELTLRQAKKGERITTLLGETITLTPSDSINSQNGRPVGITGIVGGKLTGITESTTEILLDSGNYNQTQIRKSSRTHKIHNETVLRTDKFLHPRANQLAIERATELILKYAGGEYYENVDWYPNPWKLKTMQLRLSRIEQIGGSPFKMQRVKNILKALEYEIIEESKDKVVLEIPYFRTDVIVEDDIVADILRISNYNNIKTSLINTPPPKDLTPKIYLFEEQIRDMMAQIGAHEHITEPLVPSMGKSYEVILENSLSLEKATLRSNILETLFPIVPNYQKHGKDFAFIFEIGKSFKKVGKGSSFKNYQELRHLGVIYQHFSLSPKDNSRVIKTYLATLLSKLGIDNYVLSRKGNQVEIIANDDILGALTHNTFFIEVKQLLKNQKQSINIIPEFTNYKSIDLSLAAPKTKPFGPVFQYIKNYSKKIISVKQLEDRIDNKRGRSVLLRITFVENSDPEFIKQSLITDIKKKFSIQTRLS